MGRKMFFVTLIADGVCYCYLRKGLLADCPAEINAQLRSDKELDELLKEYPHMRLVRDSRNKK